MKRFVALSLVTLSAIAASAQIPPPAETWGEPVEGVQLRLALSTTGLPPTPPGELPVFEVQIRNRGSSAVTVNPDMIDCADIEIDGVWYTQVCANTGSSRPVDIAPGSRSDVMRMRPNDAYVMFEMHAKPAPRAGSHSVRVRNAANSVYTVRADKKAGFVQKWLKLDSNRITIDIPASTTAQIKP